MNVLRFSLKRFADPISSCSLSRPWAVSLAAAIMIGAFTNRLHGAATWVHLTEVPNYDWYAGCFGTASGNLFGYWDRHGFPDFYQGPTGGGVAPLDSFGGNIGIRSMWASRAGFDGRPADKPGHIDDYWANPNTSAGGSYESTDEDPFNLLGRPEHEPDCVGDFIGLSQKKWTNMNGECDGNINAYSFVYWDTSGDRRENYRPSSEAGEPARDIQSGLRDWSHYRGYEADVFTQLTDFNPHVPAGHGFTFEDLKREINAGYPVLIFLQSNNQFSRSLSITMPMPKANPIMHGMMIYGYYEDDTGYNVAIYRTSWASSDDFGRSEWNGLTWQAGLPVRGVIGYHPKPKITEVKRQGGTITISWHGPTSRLYNVNSQVTTPLHRYVVERSEKLYPAKFVSVTSPTTELSATVADEGTSSAFFRVRLENP